MYLFCVVIPYQFRSVSIEAEEILAAIKAKGRNPLSIQVCFNGIEPVSIQFDGDDVVIPYQFRSVSIG